MQRLSLDYALRAASATLEACRAQGMNISVAIVDRGSDALSAVYCYFDPDHSKLGIGTFSVLKQIELARGWGMRYVYLGLYVASSKHMSYKANFRPHERLVDGRWRSSEELDD